MTIPTEPIGSIPRPIPLIRAVAAGELRTRTTTPLRGRRKDTIERFEATGSDVITDGEQRKYDNFWTYSVHGLSNTAPDGFKIPFVLAIPDGCLTRGPFRYKRYADSYLARVTPTESSSKRSSPPRRSASCIPRKSFPAIRAMNSSTIC